MTTKSAGAWMRRLPAAEEGCRGPLLSLPPPPDKEEGHCELAPAWHAAAEGAGLPPGLAMVPASTFTIVCRRLLSQPLGTQNANETTRSPVVAAPGFVLTYDTPAMT